MEGKNPLESASHLGMMARRAMQLGNHLEALRMLNFGLAQLQSFNYPPHYAAPFLMDLAECLWQLGNFPESLKNMRDAISCGLPNDASFAEVNNLNMFN